MSEEKDFLSRTNKNKRRQTRESNGRERKDGLLNFLIALVGMLLIVSIIIILTNTNVKQSLKKEDSAQETTAEQNQTGNENSQTNPSVDDEETEQNDESSNLEDPTNEDNSGEETSENIEEQLQYITTVPSEDPNVSVAWVDSRWTPLTTEQTGQHVNAFDRNHIDYQEKLKLLYRDTGFNETDSIVWNVKNASGDAIAVISSMNKQHIFRLTMKWVQGSGWQTVLLEQLNSLEGAY